MSVLEIAAVVTSFVAIWLTAKRRILCWPINLVACALYFKLFLDVRLYADMALQALFGVAILYGWAAWARAQGDEGEFVVVPLPNRQGCAGLFAGGVAAVVIGGLTSRYTDAALPWMDAALSSFSLVAQYWAARRHAANWLLWIAVDTLYVGMFLYKGLILTGGLYAAMIVLAMIGYSCWRRAAVAPLDSGSWEGV